MKTINIEILKKNRKYFAAKNESGYTVKILIDAVSENLEVGKVELVVEDISIRSKYGVDVIYKVLGEQKKDDKICTLKHRYNAPLVEKCKMLGGRWDETAAAWVFPSLVETEVEELDFIYNSREIAIQLTALEDVKKSQGPITFCGYSMVHASGRDSGAKLSDGISMISGRIGSGGSMKNWLTVIVSDSVFRMMVPELLLKQYQEKELISAKWDVKIL